MTTDPPSHPVKSARPPPFFLKVDWLASGLGLPHIVACCAKPMPDFTAQPAVAPESGRVSGAARTAGL